jgi:hypothetical protein
MHLLFVFHWLSKVEEDTWDRLGKHLGTLWDRESLVALRDATGNSSGPSQNRIFVPLSLSINPELPDALLGKKSGNASPGEPASTPSRSDGLHTAMAMPEGDEVVNMGDLPKNEFFGLVSQAGLANV